MRVGFLLKIVYYYGHLNVLANQEPFLELLLLLLRRPARSRLNCTETEERADNPRFAFFLGRWLLPLLLLGAWWTALTPYRKLSL